MRALNVDDMSTAQILRERLQTIDAAIQEIQVQAHIEAVKEILHQAFTRGPGSKVLLTALIILYQVAYGFCLAPEHC